MICQLCASIRAVGKSVSAVSESVLSKRHLGGLSTTPDASKSFWMTVDDVELHWTETGSGRPLIVLHGLGDSHHSWRAVTTILSERYRVYSLDLAGCGLSARPDTEYGIDYQAQLTAAWLDRLALGQVDVLGHSYGGGVSLWVLFFRSFARGRVGVGW